MKAECGSRFRLQRIPYFRVERMDDGSHGEVAQQFATDDKFGLRPPCL